jgi:hypothetical protein
MIDKDVIVKSVTYDDRSFYVNTESGYGFCLEKKYGVAPKPGDKMAVYLKGSLVRGMDLNGKRIYYKSDITLEKERQVWLDEYNREKQETFEKNKAQMDADYESLPDDFKQRITGSDKTTSISG